MYKWCFSHSRELNYQYSSEDETFVYFEIAVHPGEFQRLDLLNYENKSVLDISILNMFIMAIRLAMWWDRSPATCV